MRRDTIQIGEWRFDAASGELLRGDERVALEDRAARTLHLLCRKRGEVVSQDEIVAEVWAGRQQSPNSLAVVISDLRRALGDDARSPRHIETVTKRGYRLRSELADQSSAAAPPSSGRRRRLAAIVAAIGGLTAVTAALLATRHADTVVVRIEPVANDTGSATYAPLARAVQSLVLTDLKSDPHLTVLAPDARETGPQPKLLVKTHLILWDGHPSVELSAVDAASGATTWSGLASGPEAALPDQVPNQLAGFRQGLEKKP